MLVEVVNLDLEQKAEYINIMNEYKNSNMSKIIMNDSLHPLALEDKFCWDNVRVDRIQNNYQFNIREFVSIESGKIIACYYYITWDRGTDIKGREFFAHPLFDTDTYQEDLVSVMRLYTSECDLATHVFVIDEISEVGVLCLDGKKRTVIYEDIIEKKPTVEDFVNETNYTILHSER